MGKPFLFIKIILLIYCIYTKPGVFTGTMALTLMAVLLLMALSVLVPVMKSKYVRLALQIASILLIAGFLPDNQSLLLLVPIIVTEIFFNLSVNPLYASLIILFLLPLSIQYHLEGEYFLAIGFASIIYLLQNRDSKLVNLQKQNDQLRLLNDRLHKKLSIGEEIRQQLTYTTQLEERNKIAQEIHDKVGHSISGSLMQLEAIKVISLKDPQKAASMMDTVIATLRTGLENIRMTLRNIKPPSEQMGLNRLQLILNDFKEKHGIQTSLHYEGDISKLTPLFWKIFFENTSEALTNLLRHSKADSVVVSIFVMNKMIRYQITDNGLVTGPIKKGLGLAGMEERLLTVGGRLLVEGSKGFSLTMLVPLEGDANGHTTSFGR
ncbi:MAG: histidine kinase [Clostridia bacterium]|nr:histidine kinase [Clostridia bacterium]